MPEIIAGPTSFGAGPESQAISVQQRKITYHALATPGTGATVWSRVSAVLDAAEGAKVSDWDGQGARPVHPDAVTHAARLVASLPPEIPTPDVAVDPDGDVSLEWFANGNVFSVSVSPRGELHYAGRFGKSTVRGKETLTSHAHSTVLLPHIARTFAAKARC